MTERTLCAGDPSPTDGWGSHLGSLRKGLRERQAERDREHTFEPSPDPPAQRLHPPEQHPQDRICR